MSKKMKNTIGEFVILALAILGVIFTFKFIHFIFSHILSIILFVLIIALIIVSTIAIIYTLYNTLKR